MWERALPAQVEAGGLNFCETQQIGIESMLLILVAWHKDLPG